MAPGGRFPGATLRALRSRLPAQLRTSRAPGLRTAKTVLAAVGAFVLADALDTSSSPILAPLTALLVVQLTLYETVAHGRERIVSVVAGVLVALAFAAVTGLTWWSLGLVVALSLIAGRLLRLGPHLPEVPISAMLVLAVGGSESAAWGRVTETLIGAAVGVLVNLLIAPPLYIQPASEAIAELAERMARRAEDLAAALRDEWSRDAAATQLSRARALGEEVAHADRRLARTEESARLNPRGRLAREVEPRLRYTLDALEHAHVGLRNVSRALLDRTFFVPEEEAARAYPAPVRTALADVLDALGAALRDTARVASGPDALPGPEDVDRHLTELKKRRDRLATELVVDPGADPAAWAQYGALLDGVDRLRVEIGTALRPPAAALARTPVMQRLRRRAAGPAAPRGGRPGSGRRAPPGR